MYLDLSSNALSSLSADLVGWDTLQYIDLSGNPWTCHCDNYFLRNIIVNIVNNSSDNIPAVRCWNPPHMRDRDIAGMDTCSAGNNIAMLDNNIAMLDNTSVIAAIAGLIITVAMLAIILKYRLYCISCVQKGEKTVQSHKILQYIPYQEPRYVHSQYTVQTQYPGVRTGQYKSDIHTNTRQYKSDIHNHLGQYKNTSVLNNQHLYCSDPYSSYQPHSEVIYQTVDSTISEIK